jgi:hypothetical protein
MPLVKRLFVNRRILAFMQHALDGYRRLYTDNPGTGFHCSAAAFLAKDTESLIRISSFHSHRGKVPYIEENGQNMIFDVGELMIHKMI